MSDSGSRIGRRSILKASGIAGISTLAGCSALSSSDNTGNGNGGGNGDGNGTADRDLPGPESGTSYTEVGPLTWDGLNRDLIPHMYNAQEVGANHLRRLGIEINLEVHETSQWVDKILGAEYEIASNGLTASPERIDPYYHLYNTFHSSFIDPENQGANHMRWSNEEYDRLAEKVMTTYDEEERVQAAHRCQEILYEEQPIIFVYHGDALSANDPRQFENWGEMVGYWTYWNMANFLQVESIGDTDQMVRGHDRTPLTNNAFNVTNANAIHTQRLFYDTLAKIDFDGSPYEWFAEDWEAVDDTTIRANLRSGQTFTDGEPMTSEDVAYTFEAFNEFQVPYYTSYVSSVESVDTPDDTTAVFNLSEPDASFIHVSFTLVPILPKHIWDGITEEEDLEHPSEWQDPDLTGGGPFELTTWEDDEEVVLTLNEDHWAAGDIDITELVHNAYGSETAAAGALEQGEASFVQEMSPTNWNTMNENEDINAVNSPTHGTWNWYLGHHTKPLDDTAFRRALAWATNKQEIIQIALDGNGQTAHHSIAPANQQFYWPDTPEIGGNLDKAFEVLEEAGYRWDDEGALLMPDE